MSDEEDTKKVHVQKVNGLVVRAFGKGWNANLKLFQELDGMITLMLKTKHLDLIGRRTLGVLPAYCAGKLNEDGSIITSAGGMYSAFRKQIREYMRLYEKEFGQEVTLQLI